MTRKQALKLLLLPVLVGLVAVSGTYALLHRVVPPPPEEVQVVAAARATAAGATLTASDLVLKGVPPALTGPETMTDLKEAVGKVSRVPLVPGELVLRSKLMLPGTSAGLGMHLPAGYRALTVSADEVKAVAGLLEPGDRVDVMATFPADVAGAHKTRLLLEDVQVLAVGGTTEVSAPGKDSRAREMRSVTLAVTPEQAVALTLAEEVGHVRLALRPLAGEWTRGEIELTTASFAAGATSRIQAAAGPLFRGVAAVFEVQSSALSTLGLGRGWQPGMEARDSGFRQQLDGLVSKGKARLMARWELVAGSGSSARWDLVSSAAVSARGGVSWMNYGLMLEVHPVARDKGEWTLAAAAETRYLDVPASGVGGTPSGDARGVFPIEEVRPGSERLSTTISLGAAECLVVHGLLSGQVLVAPEGSARLALPAVLHSDQVVRGDSELLVLVWAVP